MFFGRPGIFQNQCRYTTENTKQNVQEKSITRTNKTHHTKPIILLKTKCNLLSVFQRHGNIFAIDHPVAFRIRVADSSCKRLALLFIYLTRASPPSDLLLMLRFIVLCHDKLVRWQSLKLTCYGQYSQLIFKKLCVYVCFNNGSSYQVLPMQQVLIVFVYCLI